MADSELTKLTGLWLNDSKNGKYFSGKINQKSLADLSVLLANSPGVDLRIVIFKNRKAEKENDPGYNLFCQVDKPRDAAPAKPVDDDPLPF